MGVDIKPSLGEHLSKVRYQSLVEFALSHPADLRRVDAQVPCPDGEGRVAEASSAKPSRA
jgi:hypothetical protein